MADRKVRQYASTWCVLLAFFTCAPLQAAQLKVYQYTQPDGVVAFTDRPPAQGRYKVLRYDCFACGVKNSVDFSTTPLFVDSFHSEIMQAASQHQLDSSLIRAVIHAESAFNPRATSKAGASGLMQLMPDTARQLGVADVWSASHNIAAGSAYLASLLQQFGGDQQLALAAYNAGPGAVSRFGGVPPFAETKAYLQRVQILQQRYKRHQDARHQ